jgi:membrane protease YdiL (CAAX protease family)
MSRLLSLFRNAKERRPRAVWRLILFLLLVAVIANPLILLLDATNNQFLEASLENLFVAIGFGLALVISARYFERRSLKDYGLCFHRAVWVELGVGFAVGGTIMAVVFAVQYLADWITVQDTMQTTIVATPFVLAFSGQVLRYFGGSFFEELFSRGYLLRMIAESARGAGMRRAGAVVFAAGTTALLFGLLHLLNPGASSLATVNLTLLGLLFALPMIMTGRLALSIGLHMGWNVFQNNVFGLPNSGKPSNTSLLVTQDVGPAIWTGGAFGPEGGLTVFLATLLGLVAVGGWLRFRNQALRLELSLAEPPSLETHENE